MGIIYIIGIVQAFFIEFLLLNKKRKSLADTILAVWIFILGLHLFLFYLNYIGYYETNPHIQGFLEPLPLVHGPLLLFYVISLISITQRINRLLWLNFIPAILYFLYLVPKFFLSREELLHWISKIEVDPTFPMILFSILIDASGPVYILWSLIILRKFRKNLGNNFSYTEKINLNWLKNIIYGMILIWSMVLTANLLDPQTGPNFVFIAVTLFIFLIGFFGARQGIIFTDNVIPSDNPQTEIKVKYQKSSLKKDQAQEYYEKLVNHMEVKKPFLESKITLPQLSNRLQLNPNYVSQVINDKLNQNFFEFINKYRVDEFKKRLKTKTAFNYTLLAHGRESGFSSKSSFNEVFKKFTGQTPSQYYKELVSLKQVST